MLTQPIAFIFPAFVNDYPDDLLGRDKDFGAIFRNFLTIAAKTVDPALTSFHPASNDFLEEELRTQYISDILGCSYSQLLKEKNIFPAYSAGYSMGIYAAAFQAGAISFEDGLLLIREAYSSILEIIGETKFGMAAILGLSQSDLEEMISKSFPSIEITNQNSAYSFVLSGNHKEISELMETAKNEGALNTVMLRVSVPYHSRLLAGTAARFEKFIAGNIAIKEPSVRIISLVDQVMIITKEALAHEFVRNLYTRLNWYKTQLKLQESGVKTFIECGPCRNLAKNAKFVEGNSDFFPVINLLERG